MVCVCIAIHGCIATIARTLDTYMNNNLLHEANTFNFRIRINSRQLNVFDFREKY